MQPVLAIYPCQCRITGSQAKISRRSNSNNNLMLPDLDSFACQAGELNYKCLDPATFTRISPLPSSSRLSLPGEAKLMLLLPLLLPVLLPPCITLFIAVGSDLVPRLLLGTFIHCMEATSQIWVYKAGLDFLIATRTPVTNTSITTNTKKKPSSSPSQFFPNVWPTSPKGPDLLRFKVCCRNAPRVHSTSEPSISFAKLTRWLSGSMLYPYL